MEDSSFKSSYSSSTLFPACLFGYLMKFLFPLPQTPCVCKYWCLLYQKIRRRFVLIEHAEAAVLKEKVAYPYQDQTSELKHFYPDLLRPMILGDSFIIALLFLFHL